MKLLNTLFLCLLSFIMLPLHAEKAPEYAELKYPKMVLTMHSGEIWKGKLLEAGPNEETITILTPANQQLEFSKAEIKSITQEARKSKYDLNNPFNGEYLLIASSFPYEKANLYVRANAASFVSLDYAITESFSVGAGAFFADGLKDFPIFGRLKVSIPITDHFCLAAGGLVARFNTLTGGLAYVSASLGTDDIHASAGIAYGFINDELIPYPAFIIGGKLRFANNFALITDNLISPVDSNDSIGLVSGGLRFFISHLALDAGIMVPFASGYFTLDENTEVLPFGKLTVRIGK
ncbi:MAG: hypothetical protein ACPGJS_02270 [Flammeovirgaceae bacterium]